MEKRYLIYYYKSGIMVKLEERSLKELFDVLDSWDNERPTIAVYEIGECVLDWS